MKRLTESVLRCAGLAAWLGVVLVASEVQSSQKEGAMDSKQAFLQAVKQGDLAQVKQLRLQRAADENTNEHVILRRAARKLMAGEAGRNDLAALTQTLMALSRRLDPASLGPLPLAARFT